MSEPVTYYGQPALKPAPWDWKVPVYTFAAPVAGAAQLLGTITDLVAPDGGAVVVRSARYAAAAGTLIGGPLLIGDLHTPARWYNMLRIFRATSPMSIGSWLLTSLGAFSSAAALAQAAIDFRIGGRLPRRAASAVQLPAALAGAGMSVYSASLFTATSSPLWAAAPRALAVKFGSSAMAAAAAGLSLLGHARGEPSRQIAALERIACAATIVDLGATVACGRSWRRHGVGGPLDEPSGIAAAYRLGSILLGQVLPLACHGMNASRERPSRTLSIIASAGIFCGGYLMRVGVIEAGKRSSERPVDSLRFAGAPQAPRHGWAQEARGEAQAKGGGEAALSLSQRPPNRPPARATAPHEDELAHAHAALEAFERLLAQGSDLGHEDLAQATRALVQMRDRLVAERRAASEWPQRRQQDLDRVNALLSLASSAQFPIVGVRWQRLCGLRDALRELIDDWQRASQTDGIVPG